ncbi:hypothetical protein ABIF39_008878 [Bradyrhizobium diazoefficiens]
MPITAASTVTSVKALGLGQAERKALEGRYLQA